MDWTGAAELAAVAIVWGAIWLAGAAWCLTCDYLELQRVLRQRDARRPAGSTLRDSRREAALRASR